MFVWCSQKTKHADVDQYKYSGYGIGFDRKGSYSIGNEISRNVIIFGVDMSSSTKINGTVIIEFKAKDSEINPYELCLGNISKDWSVDNMKKTRLKGYVYDFSVDYDSIKVSDILDIHKYLMEKNGIVLRV